MASGYAKNIEATLIFGKRWREPMYELLDNPIWNALSKEQSGFSVGDEFARRFLPSIGPLSGLSEQSVAAYASLKQLCKSDEQLVLFLPEPPSIPADWHLDVDGRLVQMVLEQEADRGLEQGDGPQAEKTGFEKISRLTQADVPEMLELTHMTKPGPFREQTHELGAYLGIRIQGQLVAMAGERLKPSGLVEVSAVCTHPQFQGQGYAQALISAVCQQIKAQHKTPFLHVWSENARAIQVYEKLGFRIRRKLYLAVVSHSA